jgi:peptide/nickel transport system permease protein
MTTTKTEPTPNVIPTFIDDDIGLLRRIWRGRIWYGTEWYITVFGGVILVIISLITIFAPQFAPFDPLEFVGGQFIPPYGGHQAILVRAGENPISSEAELFGVHVGVHRNQNGNIIANDLELDFTRYQLQDQMLDALRSGEVDVILIDERASEAVLSENPGFKMTGTGIGQRFILGTDHLGRDILSRLIWGARTILGVAVLSALLSSIIGISLGLISGFVSGPPDRVLTLIMDSLYAFPGLLLAIALAAMLGPGVLNVTIAISVIYIPTFFRIVRGQVLSIKEHLYIEAARSLGAKSREILTRYIFPNVLPSVVVVFSLNIADAILTEAGLSFLGLGLPPDIPDWGFDISKGRQFLVAGHWWMITLPGFMITLVALGFSLLGEGLSEILNPRLVKG